MPKKFLVTVSLENGKKKKFDLKAKNAGEAWSEAKERVAPGDINLNMGDLNFSAKNFALVESRPSRKKSAAKRAKSKRQKREVRK